MCIGEPSKFAGMEDRVFSATWSVSNRDAIDREIVHLATICGVRLFDAEVLDRLLHGDASICAIGNPYALKKLRGMVMLYYHVRMRAVYRLGDAHSTLLAQSLAERLLTNSASQDARSALPAGETSP